MIRFMKKITVFTAAAAMAFSCSMTSPAAVRKEETRTPITSISVTILSNVEADTEYDESTVLVISNSDQYTIGSYQWVGAKEQWKIGDVPKVKIEIHARNGYYFDKTTGAKKFNITGADYKSAKSTNEKETIELTVELKPAKGTLEEPDDAEWVGYPIGKASWTPVESAGAYELKLYRNGQVVYSVEKVTTTTYDFLPYMTQGGRYEFRVRAIPKNTEEQGYVTSSEWIESDRTIVDEDESSPFYGKDKEGPSGKFTPDQIGWQKDNSGEWYYRKEDGTYPSNDWLAIDGSWYLFDSEGYMLTGWQMKGQFRYFMNENGQMQVGWLEDNKQWYFLGPTGAMWTGWLELNGQWYYMNQDGVMQTGWILVGGQWYYMEPSSGAMMRNVVIEGRYINNEGVMVQ